GLLSANANDTGDTARSTSASIRTKNRNERSRDLTVATRLRNFYRWSISKQFVSDCSTHFIGRYLRLGTPIMMEWSSPSGSMKLESHCAVLVYRNATQLKIAEQRRYKRPFSAPNVACALSASSFSAPISSAPLCQREMLSKGR